MGREAYEAPVVTFLGNIAALTASTFQVSEAATAGTDCPGEWGRTNAAGRGHGGDRTTQLAKEHVFGGACWD